MRILPWIVRWAINATANFLIRERQREIYIHTGEEAM